MKKSQRLTPISKVNRDKENAALRVLAECQRQLDDQRRRVSELEGYREEYVLRLEQLAARGASAQEVVACRGFIDRLGEAIVQQQRMAESCEREVEQQRSFWLATRRDAEVMDKVIERCRRDEQRDAERREQRAMDDRRIPGVNETDN